MFAIETEDLTKRYGAQRGIEAVSLQVPQGEIVGFIGPNGAGKSTTIRVLLGLLRPDSGRASLLGRDIAKDGPVARQDVGYVPGESAFYDDMTTAELLAWFGAFHGGGSEARRRELASALDLDLSRRAVDLSLGNRKKAAIVAALQHRPRLVILDEPTNGLDPVMQARLFDLLQAERARGATVFFSSHVLSEVQRVCTRVVVLSEGRVVAVEDVEALRRRQRRRVTVTLAGEAAPDAAQALGPVAAVPGVEAIVTADAHGVTFLFGGEFAPLLTALATLRPLDVKVEEPSLEEIFLTHYTRR